MYICKRIELKIMQNRINKIKDYFIGFNIADGIAYVKVMFPEKWSVTDTEILESNFSASVVSAEDRGIYFYSDMNNGITNLFDAIDFTIDFNKDMEKKSQLFVTKLEELKNLFSTLTLEELMSLEFVIMPKTKVMTKENKPKRTKTKKEKKDDVIETAVATEEESGLEEQITNNDISLTSEITDNNNDSLLAYAESIVNG